MSACPTTGAVLAEAAAALAQAGIEAPAREARLLLAHALGLPANSVPDRSRPVDPAPFRALLARRCAREPMALIVGHCGFWTLDLEVSPATLIPRADSETLVEAALAAWPDRALVRRVLDLGTGTGCLLLACLSEFPQAWGLGIDRSPPAAALARRNADRLGLGGRCAMLCANWADPLAAGAGFELVLSNPPYIESADIPRLMPEVAAHEPRGALDGGADGLAAYRAILPALPRLLAPGGMAVLELGRGQPPAVSALAVQQGLAVADLRDDMAGIPRALVLARPRGEK
jgi:release factor glutamine methyltransferase